MMRKMKINRKSERDVDALQKGALSNLLAEKLQFSTDLPVCMCVCADEMWMRALSGGNEQNSFSIFLLRSILLKVNSTPQCI